MSSHIPALRRGRPYESLDRAEVTDYRTGSVLATVSQVNAGIIRKDLAKISESRAALKKFSVAQLVEISAKAGELFLQGTLPLGGKDGTQSPQEYIAKLDHGFGRQFDTRLSFYPTTQCLGLVMPSNSPAVNSLWLPAIPLKIPVVIKPGREEPWTPFRLIQAFIAAGCPAEAFSFYPTDHEGAGEILRSCGRALIFGDKATTSAYAGNPAIQIHGPGYSKLLIGEDEIEQWPDFIDLIASTISDNGGRSCINVSTVVVPRHAAEIAETLAKRLGPLAPLPASDDQARLSGFANPKMADYIDSSIEEGLKTPGASDITASHRRGPRKAQFEGGSYLRPTIVLCDSFAHPLANREFLCPYASVIEVPQVGMLRQIGPSLAVTAITKDPAFIAQLLESPLIERLNIGPISTLHVSWDQPHEGNLFELLYKRRSIEMSA
jgi:acyl-CoA reductase-like NAD-dependent aldehyde dehydrogenase